jgi:hypothetical protein
MIISKILFAMMTECKEHKHKDFLGNLFLVLFRAYDIVSFIY